MTSPKNARAISGLVATYSDAGVSGSRADNRPALQDALSAVCGRKGAALVVYSLSRLARSTKDAIGIAERLDKAGADLVSLSERIDTSSAAGKMVFRLLAVFAEFERDLVSERTKAALRVKSQCGERVSGRLPIGFALHSDGVTLVKDKHEQAVIDIILAMRQQGQTLRAICDALASRGIRNRAGGRWTHQRVSKLPARERNKQNAETSTQRP